MLEAFKDSLPLSQSRSALPCKRHCLFRLEPLCHHTFLPSPGPGCCFSSIHGLPFPFIRLIPHTDMMPQRQTAAAASHPRLPFCISVILLQWGRLFTLSFSPRLPRFPFSAKRLKCHRPRCRRRFEPTCCTWRWRDLHHFPWV